MTNKDRFAARLYGGLQVLTFRAVALAEGLGRRLTKKGNLDKFDGGKRIALFTVAIVLLYPLVGILYDFHHGSASGNLAVNVLWAVLWIGFTVIRLIFIVLLVKTAYRYLMKGRVRTGGLSS